jgi:hypothetical protein
LKPIWKRSMVLVLNGVNTFYFYALFVNISTPIIIPSSFIIPSMGIGINSSFLYNILRSDNNDQQN